MTKRSLARIEFLQDIITIWVDSSYEWFRPCSVSHNTERNRYESATIRAENPHTDGWLDHTVSVDTIASGINRILTPTFTINTALRKTLSEANRLNDASSIDADIADCILQAAIYNELVFS